AKRAHREIGPSQPYRLENLSVQYGPVTLTAQSDQRPPDSSFAKVVDFISQVRSLALSLVFFGALVVLVLIVADELWTKRVTIGPIHVPDAFKSLGYSEEVVTSRLLDAIGTIQAAASKAKNTTIVSLNSASLNVEVPEIGVSLASVTELVRNFLGIYDTAITGELVCVPSATKQDPSNLGEVPQAFAQSRAEMACRKEWLALRLRVSQPQRFVDIGAMGDKFEQPYFALAAEDVLNIVDPYVVASSYFATDPDKALMLAKKMILDGHPDSKFAFNLIGSIYWKRKDFESAEKALNASIDLDPKFARPHNGLGLVLGDAGDVERAIAEFRKAIELDRKDAVPRNNLANRLADKGDIEGAIAEYKKAIKLDPKYALPHNNLGNRLAEKGDIEGAIAEYEKAIELDPKYASPHNSLGNVLARKGDVEGAIDEYKKAIELNPKFALPHNNLGNRLAEKGDIEGAIAEYKKAIELDPNYAHAYADLAEALAGGHRYSEALPFAVKAADINASLVDKVYMLADQAAANGDVITARAAATEYLRRAPGGLLAGAAKTLLDRLKDGMGATEGPLRP